MTALGSATVFLFRRGIPHRIQRVFLGFAAGVMVAASVWSLLIPAMDMAAEQGGAAWLPAAGGFVLGWLFLLALDHFMPHLHVGESAPEGFHADSLRRTTLLVLAVTLHNICLLYTSCNPSVIFRSFKGRSLGISRQADRIKGDPDAQSYLCMQEIIIKL